MLFQFICKTLKSLICILLIKHGIFGLLLRCILLNEWLIDRVLSMSHYHLVQISTDLSLVLKVRYLNAPITLEPREEHVAVELSLEMRIEGHIFETG